MVSRMSCQSGRSRVVCAQPRPGWTQPRCATMPSIPKELMNSPFEPLRRHGAADSHGERESPGLGLFIVRQVALAHGGDVSVDSADAGRASR